MSDYTAAAAIQSNQTFQQRISMCCVEQAYYRLQFSGDPADLALAQQIVNNMIICTGRMAALMAADVAFQTAYDNAGGNTAGIAAITDGMILSGVNAYWHLIATGTVAVPPTLPALP